MAQLDRYARRQRAVAFRLGFLPRGRTRRRGSRCVTLTPTRARRSLTESGIDDEIRADLCDPEIDDLRRLVTEVRDRGPSPTSHQGVGRWVVEARRNLISNLGLTRKEGAVMAQRNQVPRPEGALDRRLCQFPGRRAGRRGTRAPADQSAGVGQIIAPDAVVDRAGGGERGQKSDYPEQTNHSSPLAQLVSATTRIVSGDPAQRARPSRTRATSVLWRPLGNCR